MTPTDEVFLEVGACLFRNHPREDCPEGFLLFLPRSVRGSVRDRVDCLVPSSVRVAERC